VKEITHTLDKSDHHFTGRSCPIEPMTLGSMRYRGVKGVEYRVSEAAIIKLINQPHMAAEYLPLSSTGAAPTDRQNGR
jgi:hypothetical protein